MRTLQATGRIAVALVLVLAMVGLAFVVTAPPARANHDTIAWSDPVTVASSTGFTYPESWIVADGHGYIYVFYITRNTGAGTNNINVTKYAAAGALGLPQKLFDTQVNDVANVVASYPIAATIDGSGNLYVAWTRLPTTGGDTIYVSESSDGGATWQSAKLASSPASAGSNFWPSIVAAPDGTVYVSWVQYWGTTYSVTVSKTADHGLTYSAWTNATSAVFIWSTSLAADASGRLYLGALVQPTGSSSYVINVSSSDDGAAWSAPQTLSNPSVSALFPAVLADSKGIVHVAWYASAPGGYVIDASQSADRGATWTGAVPITASFSGGYVGYLAGEGDTVMYVMGDYDVTGFGFALSADNGMTWYPVATVNTGATSFTAVAADQNGTFWASALDASGHLTLRPWYGPPSRPVVDGVAANAAGSLTVTWMPSPEQNVVDYRISRSSDGTNYQVVALVSGTATSYTDTGLANGTYYYIVTALNAYGTPSHDSAAVTGTVGPTTAQLIADLQSQITALQDELAQVNATTAAALAAARAQITTLQNQLTSLQNSQAASNAATAAQLAQLQANLTRLQNQLNTLQGQQATQTISYANLAFEIIVVVLLVVLLLNQMRRPKQPRLMMAQPGQVAPPPPKQPEDDL